MSHIFLSYSRKDSAFADHLRQSLEHEGFGVWMDQTQIPFGEKWEREIEQAIKRCAAFVVVMSPESQQSQPVEREIELAEKSGKPVFPVLLAGYVWPRLASYQVADMSAGINAPLPPRFAPALGRVVKRAVRRSRLWRGGVALTAAAVLVVIGLIALITLLPRGEDDDITPPPPTATTAPTPHSTATPIPAGSAAEFGVRDEMTLNDVEFVYVPSGCFMMGSTQDEIDAAMQLCEATSGPEACANESFTDEEPAHTVCLDGYWIGQTEVTNAQYKQCVGTGDCTPPGNTRYYYDAQYANHPVTYVDWNQASAYVAWLAESTGTNMRLPTEAQWEYAAAGPASNRYPWGDMNATCTLANIGIGVSDCVGHTSPVGSYPAGASWVGALDMSGNVREWVADWYGEAYYATLGDETWNPVGPLSGEDRRVLRGGAWSNAQNSTRAAYRGWDYPSVAVNGFGFRVVYIPY